MKKILLLVFILGTFSTHAGSKIRRYQNKVKKVCKNQDVSLLLLKKSLIELIKGEECNGRFTTLVLNKCDGLNCQQINQIYKEVEQTRSGAVVGDEY